MCWYNWGRRNGAITVAHAVCCKSAGNPGCLWIRTSFQRARDCSICIYGPWLSCRTAQSRLVDQC